MIDLHTWPTPNGRKVSIMLEEVGLPYAAHPVDIAGDGRFAPDFLKISPNNKIPAIVDRGAGVTMMESGAILLYLAEKTGRLLPREGQPRWTVLQWLMWQMGGVGPMLGRAQHFSRFNPGRAPFAEDSYAAEVGRLHGVLDRQLAQTPFVAGDYSIADIALWPWIARFDWHGVDLNGFPDIRRWYLDIAGRPAVQRGYHVPRKVEAIPLP